MLRGTAAPTTLSPAVHEREWQRVRRRDGSAACREDRHTPGTARPIFLCVTTTARYISLMQHGSSPTVHADTASGYESARAIRFALADPDDMGRMLMRDALRKHHDLVLVGSPASVAAVRRLMATEPPDVLFIEMTMCKELLNDAPAILDETCVVVHSVAADADAFAAFDIGATSLLRRPFATDSVRRAIARVRARLRELDVLYGTAASGRVTLRAETGIDVGSAEHPFLIDRADIEWLSARGRTTVLYAAGVLQESRISLNDLMRRLGDEFVMPHRGHLVRRQAIRAVETTEDGGYVVVLASNHVIPIAKRQLSIMRSALATARARQAVPVRVRAHSAHGRSS